MEFLYDHTGVFAVKYNNATYFYRKNAQNDIISLLDNSGNVVVQYHGDWLHFEDVSAKVFEATQDKIGGLIARIEKAEFANPQIKQEFLLAAKGDSLLTQWCAAGEGVTAKSYVDFDQWLGEYRQNWLEDSKQGELDELCRMFAQINNK